MQAFKHQSASQDEDIFRHIKGCILPFAKKFQVIECEGEVSTYTSGGIVREIPVASVEYGYQRILSDLGKCFTQLERVIEEKQVTLFCFLNVIFTAYLSCFHIAIVNSPRRHVSSISWFVRSYLILLIPSGVEPIPSPKVFHP